MSEEVTVEYVFEYWDCPQCGRRGIRGDVLTCPDCGTPRNENIRFYRKEAQEERVTSDEQVEKFEAGPDWKCSFCTTLNPAQEKSCRGCGHSRDESDKNYFEMQEAVSLKAPKPSSKRPTALRRYLSAGLVLLVTLVAISWCWATRTHTVAYRVSSVHWERSIPLLRYQWVEKEDWTNEVQGDSVQRISERRDVHHYEKRLVGSRTEFYTDTERVSAGSRRECTTSYKSTGSGASRKETSCRSVPQYTNRSVRRSREVPVYRDFPVMAVKVRYKAKTYAPLRMEKLEGDDVSPRWPEVKLASGLDEKPDKEGERHESYLVVLQKADEKSDGPPQLRTSPDAKLFVREFAPGKSISFKISNAGKVESPFPNLEFEKLESR